MIHFIAENVEMPDMEQDKVIRWLKSVAAAHGMKAGNITYVFCNDERMLEVNKQYLQHDYYTDIITFDYSSGKIISGDIFIGTETVLSNAKELNINFINELYRVVAHGVLHLCGQDDKTVETRIEMTQKENAALEQLINFME